MIGGTGRAARSRGFDALAAAVSLAGFVYVVYRADAIPLTYDEAAAYYRFIATPALSIFNFTVATNHFLHTVLTRLLHAAAGDSELVLRLSGLAGYALYSGFSYLIAARLRHRVIAGAGFILLHVNPYLLDFFALSRGYGLSLGLLMGAVFFLLRFLTGPGDASSGARHLSRSLGFGAAAVLANYTMLNAYLAIIVVAAVSLTVFRPAAILQARLRPADPSRWRHGWRWTATAVAILLLIAVFSQDVDLSPSLYEPVTIRISGPPADDLEAVRVFRVDVRGRASGMTRHGNTWALDSVRHCTGLRIEMPIAVIAKVESIAASIGAQRFQAGPDLSPYWTSVEKGDTRVLHSTPALSLPAARPAAFRSMINWAGDRGHVLTVAKYSAGLLLLLALAALLLKGMGHFAFRLRLSEWEAITGSALWVATVAGPPLYILNRGGELYFGGVTGLIKDTFRSLIEGSLYGRTYHQAQVGIVLAALVLCLVMAAPLVYLRHRRGESRAVIPFIALTSMILLVSASLLAQHMLFETPYLKGRTALLYIPLYLLFVTLLFDAVADLGRAWRTAAVGCVSLAVGLSAWHFASAANVRHAFEWRDDAATKMMIADVAEIAARGPAAPVTLGVEPMFFPVASFYAARTPQTDIRVEVLPSSDAHFEYVRAIHDAPTIRVIARYRTAGTLLLDTRR